MIALVIQYFLCVLPMVKIWHFSGRFDQHLSLYCGSVEPKFKTAGILVLVNVLWVTISKIYRQFWHGFFKYIFKSSFNFYAIEITWRKMARSVCLKPVSNGNVTCACIMTFHCTSVFSFLVRIVLFLNFVGEIYFSKILLHHSTSGIRIILPHKETKIIEWRSSRV